LLINGERRKGKEARALSHEKTVLPLWRGEDGIKQNTKYKGTKKNTQPRNEAFRRKLPGRAAM